MVRQEHVFIKSYLTFRGKLAGLKKHQYYMIFGKFKQPRQDANRFFLRFHKNHKENDMPYPMEFDIDEFCGLEVGCTQEKKGILFKTTHNRTFLRLLLTETRTLEFVVEKESDRPLVAFRTIETWRKKFSKELGYRCYWNVYIRECGKDWSEGYGKLHLTYESLAIVSTDKFPQTLGHWQLKNATKCNYTKNNFLIIRFLGQDEPLQLETEDAEEIAKTLAKNMPELSSQPVYMAMPSPTDEPPHGARNRKSVRVKGIRPPSDSDEDSDTQSIGSASSYSESPNIWVPATPDNSPRQFSYDPEHVSPGEIAQCEKTKKNHTVYPSRSPNVGRRDNYNDKTLVPLNRIQNPSEGQYEPAAPVNAKLVNGYCGGPEDVFVKPIGEKQKKANLGYLKMARPHHLAISMPDINQPTSGEKPIPSPRLKTNDNSRLYPSNPPPRPAKSPILNHRKMPQEPVPRSPLPADHPQPPLCPHPSFEQKSKQTIRPPESPRHPQGGRTPVPSPRQKKPISDAPNLQKDYLKHDDIKRMNETAIKCRTLPLMKKLSRSLDSLATIDSWHRTLDNSGGGRIISRHSHSRKVIKKSSLRKEQLRPRSSYSDADIEDLTDDKIYDVSHILDHLNDHLDDRSYRQSTMWYVNMLSSFDRPADRAKLSTALVDSPPPPLPPRDKQPEPIAARVIPTVSSEYWSAMNICHTLRMVLQKDAPHPDTLQLSGPLRNKVCMHLYITNLGTKDWRDLADIVGLEHQAVEIIEAFTAHHNQQTAAEIVLRHWQHCYNRYGYDRVKCRKKCTRKDLEQILHDMQRHDIIQLIKEDRSVVPSSRC